MNSDNPSQLKEKIKELQIQNEQLKESNDKYRILFENAPIGVFRTDFKGNPLMANKTMAHILGFKTQGEVLDYYHDLGKQLYVDPQRRQEFLQILRDQGWVDNFEYKAKRKDGKYIWLSMTAKVSKEKNDNDFVIDGFTSDVTERKEAEMKLQNSYEELETTEEELKTSNEELQEANQKLEEQKERAEESKETAEKYLNIAAEIILSLDLEGNIIMLNDSGHRLLGYEKGELIGKNWFTTCIPKASRNSVRQILDKVAQGVIEKVKLVEGPVITKTGERKIILWHNSYLTDKTGILTSGEDITERKETEKQLEESENFISALLNNLNVGVVACDAEGILTYFNKKTKEFHGLPLENIPPEEWANYYDLYTVDGQTKLNTEEIPLYRALNGEYFNEIEMVIKPKEGNSLSILNSGQPLKDVHGNITGAVVAMHDITERKQAEFKLQKKYEEIETTEEELRASNEELQDVNEKLKEQKAELEVYKRMVESSEDMMAVVDVNYNYISVNNAYLEYYQLKREEVIGFDLKQIIGNKYFEETVKLNIDKCLNGETVQFEMTRELPEFGKIHLDIIYYPLEIGKGVEGVVSAIRDITERKKYEKELYNAKKRAEESEALTRQNLYNIEFLANCAMSFVDKRYENDIYNYIAEKIRELNPEVSFVIVNEVDYDNSVIETKAFEDANGSVGQFVNDLGIQIIGQQYKFDDRITGLSDGKIKKINGGIHELSFESIPKDVAAKIEDELEIESIYGIAFILNDKIFADAFLLFPKGKEIQNIQTIEAFVGQASLAFKRRESEKELIEARNQAEATANKFYSLVEQSSEMLFLHDLNGQIVEVNRAGEINTGYSREELYRMNVLDVDPDAIDRNDMKKYWKALSVNDSAVTFETRHKRKDGTIYPAEIVVSKIVLENKKYILAIARDITERKQAEEQLIKAKEKAEESDRLKSAFLANMSHEIRTPMNGIMGFSQMLQEKEFSREKQKKFLGIIHSRTKHLLQIISDIVDIAKLEACQLSVNEENFYLNDAIKELYDFYKKGIENKGKTGIQLQTKLGLNREQSFIRSDPTRIRQVLDNLLSNAIKYTDEGKVEIGYGKKSKDTLLFWVKDTGTGISSENHDKIFERFRQAEESNQRSHEGTGLGLTISKNLVEMLGGNMWVDSKEKEGSVFYFTLPYEREYKVEKNGDNKEDEDFDWQEKSILIVEDDLISLEYMKEIIEPTGATTILKKTGEEGYQAYKENFSVDLILMDIRLPDISGLEIIKRIRKTDKNVKIIAQTAHAMGEDRNIALQAGANDYIAKPIVIGDFLRIIDKYI
jgi:PAS domain S-box-containing protein